MASEAGANAIEYAVIAALIGIGLIGSLTTTRGSLSAIFGIASTQMASSGAGSTASAGLTVPDKTLQSSNNSTSGGTKTTSWTYTDGTVVRLDKSATGSNLYIQNPATNAIQYVTLDPSGVQTMFENDAYNTAGYSGGRTTTYASGTDYTSGTPTAMTTLVYNASGQRTATTTGATPSDTFLQQAGVGSGDVNYFIKIQP
jgi:Flp pilus assembly pilin Flp